MKTLTGLARRIEFERRGGSWRSARHASERVPGLAIRAAGCRELIDAVLRYPA